MPIVLLGKNLFHEKVAYVHSQLNDCTSALLPSVYLKSALCIYPFMSHWILKIHALMSGDLIKLLNLLHHIKDISYVALTFSYCDYDNEDYNEWLPVLFVVLIHMKGQQFYVPLVLHHHHKFQQNEKDK